MTYHMILGDYAYSSWSLRGWLLLENFGISAKLTMVDFNGAGAFKPQTVGEQMAEHAPARTVPTLITPEGIAVWDSIAIAEELATRHPDAGLWPKDPALRAIARTLTAEMHSGFTALRGDCPMNLRASYRDFPASDDVLADVARLDTIWTYALNHSNGPWLAGAYCAVDAFYAPIAGRIAGYGLPLSDGAQAYVDRHLSDPAFRRWRAMGLVHGDDLSWYARKYTQRPWPGPAPLAAQATDNSVSENTACPYSGKPVTHFLTLDDRVFGFCNAFCRDKTVADPEAWPKFIEVYQS